MRNCIRAMKRMGASRYSRGVPLSVFLVDRAGAHTNCFSFYWRIFNAFSFFKDQRGHFLNIAGTGQEEGKANLTEKRKPGAPRP